MSVLDFIREDLKALKPYSSARLEAGQAAVMLSICVAVVSTGARPAVYLLRRQRGWPPDLRKFSKFLPAVRQKNSSVAAKDYA